MPSLRYHAGRMVLYEEKPKQWRVKIKLKTNKLDLPLTATDLESAVLEAEYLYADAKSLCRSNPLCVDCVHHEILKAECGLGMPEGKASGGIWAKDCAYFWKK